MVGLAKGSEPLIEVMGGLASVVTPVAVGQFAGLPAVSARVFWANRGGASFSPFVRAWLDEHRALTQRREITRELKRQIEGTEQSWWAESWRYTGIHPGQQQGSGVLVVPISGPRWRQRRQLLRGHRNRRIRASGGAGSMIRRASPWKR